MKDIGSAEKRPISNRFDDYRIHSDVSGAPRFLYKPVLMFLRGA